MDLYLIHSDSGRYYELTHSELMENMLYSM